MKVIKDVASAVSEASSGAKDLISFGRFEIGEALVSQAIDHYTDRQEQVADLKDPDIKGINKLLEERGIKPISK